MAEWVPPAQLLPRLDQLKSNLRRWKPLEWVLFWGVVPAILLLVFALPQAVRDEYLILNTVSPWRVQTWFLSSYAHSQLYPHLAGNLAFYLIVLLMIFAFEDNRRRFWLLAGWSFLVVPFMSSLLTILFWDFIGRNTTGQGFSAITGALLAYAIFIFVVWGIGEKLGVFDDPELFTGSRVPQGDPAPKSDGSEGDGAVQGGGGTKWLLPSRGDRGPSGPGKGTLWTEPGLSRGVGAPRDRAGIVQGGGGTKWLLPSRGDRGPSGPGKGTLWQGSRARYLVAKILLAVILALIVVMGLESGVFMDVGGSVSNGIAHFGGFITSLVLLLAFDLQYERRRYFDTMLAAAILVGVFWYGLYLARLVKVVTGG
jgi:hypothetical protein